MFKGWFSIICIAATLSLFTSCKGRINGFTQVEKLPQIFPDYTSIVIPANIAPLNFTIDEKGSEYIVEIHSKSGDKIRIRQSSPEIKIPVNRWHKLLNSNGGNALNIDVYARQDKWYKFETITDTIAEEAIDDHLVYRLIGIVYTYYGKLQVCQRNIENFDQSVIFENTYDEKNPCINCHSFSNYNPKKMSLHVRRFDAGTIIYDDGKLSKLNTKTKYTMSSTAYTAWHPNGQLIAYSVNQLKVNFTSCTDKIVEVWDKASDLVVYDLKSNTITTSPKISSQNRENLPCWSPDGKSLYYISAPKANEDGSNWVDGKYDLCRIGFNPDNLTWGEVDTLLSSKDTGKSITFPIVSPDGRYLLFSMIDHSYFSIYDKNSDLYLFDLKTNQYHSLSKLNSPLADSYHSWSKNGRWVVFSSKRIDGLCTFPYFAYFDNDGNFHKPFVMPQEDPLFYKKFTRNFNIPVFVDGKVDVNANELSDFVKEDPMDVVFDKSINIDALSGATWLEKEKTK